MKLAIAVTAEFLQQFETADQERKMLLAYEYVVEELPIVLEEMIEAQKKLDGGNEDAEIETRN